jgi:hypothetical protein
LQPFTGNDRTIAKVKKKNEQGLEGRHFVPQRMKTSHTRRNKSYLDTSCGHKRGEGRWREG